MARKHPNPTDRHVGQRVRMRRLQLGMSQEKLADQLGLTFQQVQKYEKGTNRIGASRLLQISLITGVPVAFFFEGLPGGAKSSSGQEVVDAFLASNDGLDLIKAFMAITRQSTKRKLVQLVEEIAAK